MKIREDVLPVLKPFGGQEEIDAVKKMVSTPKKEMNMEDMFGSEQVFPFEPGLGNGGRT